jgi:hypothetical protein
VCVCVCVRVYTALLAERHLCAYISCFYKWQMVTKEMASDTKWHVAIYLVAHTLIQFLIVAPFDKGVVEKGKRNRGCVHIEKHSMHSKGIS